MLKKENSHSLALMKLSYELRGIILRHCVCDVPLNVTRDSHGHLRIHNLPAIARCSKQLREEALKAVLLYGPFLVQSSATNAQFEHHLIKTVLRPAIGPPITGLELITRLNLSAFSHSSRDEAASSLAFACRCSNLRELTLNLELQHVADLDWANADWFKTVTRLRSEYCLDEILRMPRLQQLKFAGTGIGIGDQQFSVFYDLTTYFSAAFALLQRQVRVLASIPPEEI